MTRRLIVLITGSREWAELENIYDGRRVISRALADVIREYDADEVVIRHGGARGADMIAQEWAEAMQHLRRPVEIEKRPADWNHHGKGAGFRRNAEMVAEGADVCLAFPFGQSRGTRDCIARAIAAGIRVIVKEGVGQ
jgi:hypothetical protein